MTGCFCLFVCLFVVVEIPCSKLNKIAKKTLKTTQTAQKE